MSHATPTDPAKVISPKVIAAGAVAVIGTAVGAAVEAMVPGLFDSLGPWGPVVFAGVTAGGATFAAWLKSDPLRG